ncbi:hypothetical protein [Ureibacillus chungkukjangi]|uniref:Uncharacterized protein n=1 Tax=Ureibacillus chungkukjangi TaxID=1202712 RepID=A0A318U5P7_9BACL|nr:hypothetical protein [Ureibacillus chungkukjangi]PYF07239.1 hypothetical protein BJ095_10529 [Ureibacillus chungkukjangi]
MWVITVFERNTYRMFEFENKMEARQALIGLKGSAILSFTK